MSEGWEIEWLGVEQDRDKNILVRRNFYEINRRRKKQRNSSKNRTISILGDPKMLQCLLGDKAFWTWTT
jgi:hypothetical protein